MMEDVSFEVDLQFRSGMPRDESLNVSTFKCGDAMHWTSPNWLKAAFDSLKDSYTHNMTNAVVISDLPPIMQALEP